MDDLLLATSMRKSHITKLEDLLKTLLKNGLKVSPKKCQLLERNCNIWGILYSLRIGLYVLNHYEVD